MASLPALQPRGLTARGRARPGRWLLPLAGCLALAGCVPLDWCLRPTDKPPTGPVAQVNVLWDPTVYVTPDVVHGGAPLPGVAGRMFLLGSGAHEGLPCACDEGDLHVMLYNDDAPGPGGQPTLQEYWHLTGDKLKLLLRKDAIGWGYTLFLPMGTYSPSLQHVHAMVCFQPKGGTPLYAPSGPLTLHPPNTARPVVTETTFRPGVQPPPPALPPSAAAPPPAPVLQVQYLPPPAPPVPDGRQGRWEWHEGPPSVGR